MRNRHRNIQDQLWNCGYSLQFLQPSMVCMCFVSLARSAVYLFQTAAAGFGKFSNFCKMTNYYRNTVLMKRKFCKNVILLILMITTLFRFCIVSIVQALHFSVASFMICAVCTSVILILNYTQNTLFLLWSFVSDFIYFCIKFRNFTSSWCEWMKKKIGQFWIKKKSGIGREQATGDPTNLINI